MTNMSGDSSKVTQYPRRFKGWHATQVVMDSVGDINILSAALNDFF